MFWQPTRKKIFLEKLKVNQATTSAVEELLNIYTYFSNNYPKITFILDLTESNYLNYHTGTRFTIFAKNVRGEVARGGRYTSQNNSLAENSTGFNCYMDTIIRASSTIEKTKKIMIPFDICESKKNKLINDGYIIETFFGEKNKIKEIAIIKKFDAYLIEDKIIQLEKK